MDRQRLIPGLSLLVFALTACGQATAVPTVAPAPTLPAMTPAQETATTLAPVATRSAPELSPTPPVETEAVVEAFMALNQLSSAGLTYVGPDRTQLDATGPFPVDRYADGAGNRYAVDPTTRVIVVFEASGTSSATPAAPLSAEALYSLAQEFMLRNVFRYQAMREGFSLPEKTLSETGFVATWVYGTTCRRDGSFPYIDVTLSLDGHVRSYRTTLDRGDQVGAYGDVTEATVNVRAGPGLSYPVVSVRGVGRTILVGRFDDPSTGVRWWKVPVNCEEPFFGWVRDDFVAIDPAFVAAVSEMQSP